MDMSEIIKKKILKALKHDYIITKDDKGNILEFSLIFELNDLIYREGREYGIDTKQPKIVNKIVDKIINNIVANITKEINIS